MAALALTDTAYLPMPKDTSSHANASIYLLAGIYALMVLSSLVHEFGHAGLQPKLALSTTIL